MVKLANSLVRGGVLALLVSVSMIAAQTSTTTTSSKSKSVSATATATATTTGPIFIIPTANATSSSTPSPTPSSSSGNSTTAQCPGPLIPNTMNLQNENCHGSCCIKCPAVESFYEPNEIRNVLTAAYIIRQISLGFSVFMAISYIALPGKRSQPHISVLFLTVSLSLWYTAFDLMPGVTNACVNDFEQSTAHNSKLCGVQGVLIIYFTQTSALWCSLLIYKLHLLAVWRSNWIDKHYGWFTALCFLLPLCFAIPVAVRGLAQYPGIGFSCLVSNQDLNKYLFYPTAVYMYPSMLCHIGTVAKMIRLAIMSSKIDAGLSQLSSDAKLRVTTTMQAKRLLRGQWRPALMMGSVMTLLTVFWLFYFVDAHRIAGANFNTPWIQQWLVCVYTNAGMGKSSTETQSICAKTIKSNLPSVPWFTAAEVLLAIIGIVVAGIFITKLEFWEEWRDMLSDLFNIDSSSSAGRSSPDRDDWSAPRRTKSLDDGMNTNTSAFNSSKSQLNEAPGAQWYDMEDLLDKEYDDQGNRVIQSASYGSPKNMTTYSVSSPISEPPRYNSGDLLYRTNANAYSVSGPSSPTNPSSPTGAYIELPVVPTPVPRTPKMNSREHVYLSNSAPNSGSIPSPLPLPPVSPTIYSQGGSLSPMPPRSPQQQYRQRQQRSNPLESVPIIAVATRGSVTQAYQRSSQPSSPSSQKQRTNLYNSYESGERIQASSHGGTAGSSVKSSPNTSMRINTAVADAGTAMDSRAMSPPPSKPNKSPRRQNQPVYMSPPINVPTSPNSDSNYH